MPRMVLFWFRLVVIFAIVVGWVVGFEACLGFWFVYWRCLVVDSFPEVLFFGVLLV